MKTPEEVKKGLEVCCPKYDGAAWINCYLECPYKPEGHWCKGVLHKDVLAYIKQLEQRLTQAERERDAAVHDLKLADELDCEYCKHQFGGCTYDGCKQCSSPCPCGSCRDNSNYVWRGVCEENTKEEQQ